MRSFSLLTVVALAVLGTASVVAPGCSSASATAPNTTPELSDVTSAVFVPTYKQIDTDAASLLAASKTLQGAATAANLTAAQNAWRAARKSWRTSEAFAFGPVVSLNIGTSIDASPTTEPNVPNVAAIDAYVSGSAAIDATSFATLTPDSQGYHGIEYILFDSTNGDAAVLAKLTTDQAAGRRLSYLVVAATDLNAKTTQLDQAWDPDFAKEVTNAGAGSVLFPSGKAAVDQIVHQITNALDDVAGAKLGGPYGNQSGGIVQPTKEESPLSDNSISDMLDTVAGAKTTYATAISPLVKAKNPALDTQVLAAFDAATAKITAIPAPFRTTLNDPVKKSTIGDAYQASKTLKNLMQVQVSNALGTTLLIDPDGD